MHAKDSKVTPYFSPVILTTTIVVALRDAGEHGGAPRYLLARLGLVGDRMLVPHYLSVDDPSGPSTF